MLEGHLVVQGISMGVEENQEQLAGVLKSVESGKESISSL